MHVCMAGAIQTLLFVLYMSVHVCACLLSCPCLFLSSVLSSLPFMFCVVEFFDGWQILIGTNVWNIYPMINTVS